MSELKDYDIMDIEAMDDERLEKSESGKIQVTRVYIKSEADKVIADLIEKNKRLANMDIIMARETIKDLEENHKKEVGQLLIEIEELKEILNNSRKARKYWRKEYLIEYKECCSQKYKRCLAMAKICENKLGTIVKPGWWDKWRRHWLKIAEQFKDKEATK